MKIGDDLIIEGKGMNRNTQPISREFGKIDGLTKREQFAAMAMQGILSGYSMETYYGNNIVSDVVEKSITFADEMIKQLKE